MKIFKMNPSRGLLHLRGAPGGRACIEAGYSGAIAHAFGSDMAARQADIIVCDFLGLRPSCR